MPNPSRASIDSSRSDEYLLNNTQPPMLIIMTQSVIAEPEVPQGPPSTPQRSINRICPGAPKKARRTSTLNLNSYPKKLSYI